MKRSQVTTLGAACALLLAPAAAHAQPSSPIPIQSCSVEQYAYEPQQHGTWFWYWRNPPSAYGLYTDGVNISYVNNTNKVASRVAFPVNYRGDVERVIDAGTFSPGATITHSFGQIAGDAFLGSNPNVCRAIAVRFQDGSVWRAAGAYGGRQQGR